MELGKFIPNRVRRLYRGGSGIDRLRGAATPLDGLFPEDWIASCVRANSPDVPPDHGLSACEFRGRRWSFVELLQEYPEQLLGAAHLAGFGANPGFLAKILDSAVRLPVQIHPDRAAALRHFNSPFGKTEAWIVLGTRPVEGEKPYLLLGFNESLDEAVFRRESLSGDYARSLAMLHRFEVEPGEVYLVPGRLPHAVGPGVTMIEVMEPTDLTIMPERLCCGREIPFERRFSRLSPEAALDVFDFTPRSRKATRALCCPAPETLAERREGRLIRRISRRAFNFFEARHLAFSGRWELDCSEPGFSVGIVTEGALAATYPGGRLELRRGESFFIPYACAECRLEGAAQIVFLLPPLPEAQGVSAAAQAAASETGRAK